MPELRKRELGTPREQAPIKWVIQQTGSFLVGELFNGGYYRDCIHLAKSMARNRRSELSTIRAARKLHSADVDREVAQLDDVVHWISEVKSDDYHTVNTHVFITLWAAQEAGIENVISEILRTSKSAAQIASERFKPGKYPVADWPWTELMCLEIAQKLDAKAKNATDNGGLNIAKRIMTLFSWFGLHIIVDDTTTRKYNEASRVRNVILHRYGRLTARDAEDFPELSQWVDEIMPITVERLKSYYQSVIAVHLAIAKAIFDSDYK
jgi:hypothetical protein